MRQDGEEIARCCHVALKTIVRAFLASHGWGEITEGVGLLAIIAWNAYRGVQRKKLGTNQMRGRHWRVLYHPYGRCMQPAMLFESFVPNCRSPGLISKMQIRNRQQRPGRDIETERTQSDTKPYSLKHSRTRHRQIIIYPCTNSFSRSVYCTTSSYHPGTLLGYMWLGCDAIFSSLLYLSSINLRNYYPEPERRRKKEKKNWK